MRIRSIEKRHTYFAVSRRVAWHPRRGRTRASDCRRASASRRELVSAADSRARASDSRRAAAAHAAPAVEGPQQRLPVLATAADLEKVKHQRSLPVLSAASDQELEWQLEELRLSRRLMKIFRSKQV
jgi:hypothetical protein